MYGSHAEAIRGSLKLAASKQSRAHLGLRMFDFFFQRFPETRSIFAETDLESFAPLKFRLVSEFILDSVQNPEYALYNMVSEIHRHAYFDVKDQAYYNGLIESCCEAVAETLGQDWPGELEGYWRESIEAAKAAVQEARHKARIS